MNSDPTVRWELDAAATGTRVTLRHRGFPTADDHRDHALGWTAYLVSLAQTATARAVQNQQA